MFPRFRIVAVSMQRLQVRRARITVVPIDMVHLNPVVMLEEHPRSSDGCLENFSRRGRCHGFKMHTISQVLNPPGEPIDSELPPGRVPAACG